jgi:hypothetical protein
MGTRLPSGNNILILEESSTMKKQTPIGTASNGDGISNSEMSLDLYPRERAHSFPRRQFVSLTIEILRTLGSPFASAFKKQEEENAIASALEFSRKNRMLFYYMDSVKAFDQNGFPFLYENENMRRIEMEHAVAKVSRILTSSDIKHAVFKTIRPYKSTTVDIDTLILEDEDYDRSIKTMEKAGYELIVHGPRSTTLWDKDADIGVDLYEQIAVSFITYIDKQTLNNHFSTKRLSNGEQFETMKPEADLACIIAHSIVKEQMYTLSEYYTFLHYLEQMDIDEFLEIVKHNNLTSAARAHTGITALLHRTAHGNTPNKLNQILERLGEENFETTRIIQRNYTTPHKYHPITLARSLLEIARSKKTRRSMGIQLYQTAHPSFASRFLKSLLEHVLRETY